METRPPMTAPYDFETDNPHPCADLELVHLTCCDDENVALCGLDLTGLGWSTEEDLASLPACVICDGQDEHDRCPRYGECREVS